MASVLLCLGHYKHGVLGMDPLADGDPLCPQNLEAHTQLRLVQRQEIGAGPLKTRGLRAKGPGLSGVWEGQGSRGPGLHLPREELLGLEMRLWRAGRLKVGESSGPAQPVSPQE